jgi:multidrug efflux pump subunit AcrA (membrane-fusion protein)
MQSILGVILSVLKDLWAFIKSPFGMMWTRKRVIAALLAVVAVAWFINRGQSDEVVAPVETTPEVAVAQVANLSGGAGFAITGSVEALAEAQLKAEAGGRVTAVTTEIGKFVSAGQVIATLDNASERASLLSAQGAYEAALASNRQGALGIDEAETGLATAKRNAVTGNASGYNTVSGVVRTTIDGYFSNPTSLNPGLRIDGGGNAGVITAARVAIEASLTKWKTESSALTASGNIAGAIENGRRNTKEVVALVDSLISALERDTDGGTADASVRAANIAVLTAARGTLLGTESALQSSLTAISAAEDAKSRAEITAGTGGPTANSAALTQALGAVRAAQAQYEKTLVRTPISGVVNALYIKRGDFVAPQADAAVIANNNGKQVVGAITEADSQTIKIGDTVRFDDVATGTVTAVAGAVDPKTGKVAIKMSVSNPELLTTGTTVSVSFADTGTNTSPVETPIIIPLTAVKLMADSAVIFTINSESKLEARTITLGRVLGDTIIVTEGLAKSDTIVIDVRGRKAGETVTVTY